MPNESAAANGVPDLSVRRHQAKAIAAVTPSQVQDALQRRCPHGNVRVRGNSGGLRAEVHTRDGTTSFILGDNPRSLLTAVLGIYPDSTPARKQHDAGSRGSKAPRTGKPQAPQQSRGKEHHAA